eukprot:TRINITY_DN6997_c0_g1_i5.p1 TRINITY_DN6997_c0_g1~~TRINITY_DN6997_c0_g1_i5.p1  ORF type:complete len:389 (-),score=44.30 TRINITY_DN6997_c0_g1_i5:80-1246(-)
MGSLLTRHQTHYINRVFAEADVQKKGYLNPDEVYSILSNFGVKTLRASDVTDRMDVYGFMSFVENHLRQVFKYTDMDEDGYLSYNETIATYMALGIQEVDESNLLVHLRRLQYMHPNIIDWVHNLTTSFMLSNEVWIICLIEFFFDSPVRDPMRAAAGKSQDLRSRTELTSKHKTYGVAFRSKIPRFKDIPSSVGPGDYETASSSLVIRDPSRPSSSFLASPRREQRSDLNIGPGIYDPQADTKTTKKFTTAFQSSSPRLLSRIPGDHEFHETQEPRLGPGLYNTLEAQESILQRHERFIIPKSPRFVNLYGTPPATGAIGPGEYQPPLLPPTPKSSSSKLNSLQSSLNRSSNSQKVCVHHCEGCFISEKAFMYFVSFSCGQPTSSSN